MPLLRARFWKTVSCFQLFEAILHYSFHIAAGSVQHTASGYVVPKSSTSAKLSRQASWQARAGQPRKAALGIPGIV